jgi:UDP-N-acetylmuramate dehydrogenase
MNTSIFQLLSERFPDTPWQQEVPLAPFTYMKIGGPAEVLWDAKDLAEFIKVVAFCREKDLPLTILGGASNVLISDAGLRGLVILNHCDAITFLEDPSFIPVEALPAIDGVQRTSTSVLVMAESGVKTASLVGATTAKSLTGLEPFLGVPGSIGGAIYNNSHYTEELIGNFIVAVEVIDEFGTRTWLSQEECRFAYDFSRFHDSKEVILRAIFHLQPGEKESIQERLKIATVKRATTQPLGTANSGCMFQNAQLTPEQSTHFGGKERISAGWLIDQAGLKGLRIGKAVVSDIHANFIVNEGGATSDEIEQLIQLVQEKVKEKFGIELQREVFFLQQPQMLQ